MDNTTITMSHETKEKLNSCGKKGETYEGIVLKLVASYKKVQKNITTE